jgi:type VI secretion system secreted protein VgrG
MPTNPTATLFNRPRALTAQSPAIPLLADGSPALVPLKLSGSEAVNSLFLYDLILQTPDTAQPTGFNARDLVLSDFIGQEVCCTLELEGHGHFTPGLPGGTGLANRGAGVREISGLITQARFIGQDSRHTLIGLSLRPWLFQATLSSDCKVFQDITPVQAIAEVLGDYPFVCETRLLARYPVRDYCVQFNESDFAFVSRLMQEWGINYHFEHRAGVHCLVLSDHNGAFTPLQKDQPESAYHRIAYHPPGRKIDVEYIHAFTPNDSLTTGHVATRDYDYTRPKASLAVRVSDPRPTGLADQESFVWHGDERGMDYSQPNAGADPRANQSEDQGRHLARLRLQALRQHGQRAVGSGQRAYSGHCARA